MTKAITLVLTAAFVLLCCSQARADGYEAKADYRRGLGQEKAGHYHAAIENFRAALEADPSYVAADRQIGNCFYYLGDKAKAFQYYERYLEVYPNDPRVRAFADSLRGKSDSGYAGAITINPVSLIVGLADLQYEQRLNPDSSLAYRLDLWDLSVGDVSWTAFGLGVFYHMYPGHHALHNFYWGPGVSVVDVNLKVTDSYSGESATGTGFAFAPAIEAGWQWVPFDAWAIDLGVSESYYVGSVSANADGTTASDSLAGFSLGARLGFGYAWH